MSGSGRKWRTHFAVEMVRVKYCPHGDEGWSPQGHVGKGSISLPNYLQTRMKVLNHAILRGLIVELPQPNQPFLPLNLYFQHCLKYFPANIAGGGGSSSFLKRSHKMSVYLQSQFAEAPLGFTWKLIKCKVILEPFRRQLWKTTTPSFACTCFPHVQEQWQGFPLWTWFP